MQYNLGNSHHQINNRRAQKIQNAWIIQKEHLQHHPWLCRCNNWLEQWTDKGQSSIEDHPPTEVNELHYQFTNNISISFWSSPFSLMSPTNTFMLEPCCAAILPNCPLTFFTLLAWSAKLSTLFQLSVFNQ